MDQRERRRRRTPREKQVERVLANLYPESEKLAAAVERRQIVMEFLEDVGYKLCYWSNAAEEYLPVVHSNDQIVLRWIGVDEEKLEQERRAMLDEIRAANDKHRGG